MASNPFSNINVMIIDDDDFMLNLVKMTIRQLNPGHITTVNCGEKAIELLKQSERPFHILLVDLQMPGMDGIELLRHLAELGFAGGVILFSGADSGVLRAAVSVARARYLNVLGSMQKPVTLESITHFFNEYEAFYSREANQPRSSLLSLSEFRAGLHSEQLQLYYQPQIDIKSGKMIGVEALARWQHPIHGILGPGAFIPMAEESQLIDEFTDTIIEKALDQIALWRAQNLHFTVAVNISSASATRLNLPEKIETSCQKRGLNPNGIILEITETHLGHDMVAMLEVLTRIRLKSLGLSIDDFGTGYSSLERLKSVPFDELKIDGSFVHGAGNDQAAKAIFESSAALAKQLSLRIVAEGVENSDDWDMAESLGCEVAQGFFVAKPMPSHELINWLSHWKGKPSLPF